ncbi:reverse transcriptase domain-containing protein [Trichonephila clavata]|uniref:Reverse transcriptase domain-containing protein n=1 Tax=Trichonephila clavata TaxID=2740835 RepID=A0A8X6HJ71_TRICU|nr:reverse transcriptase domain-containing protein [Trichonephila clavata]
MNEHLPVCVALQESLLKPCTSNIRGYSILRKDCNTGERACGGMALLINHATPFSPVLIRKSLQLLQCRSQNQKCQGPKHPQSISKYSLGSRPNILASLYRALIRSKLDYGSVVYSSACKSLLKILDPVHHQGLRLCLGAFRTSPVESLYAEAYEPH